VVRLVGIVSFGPDNPPRCADASAPGVYTEVADAGVHAYLAAPTHTAAPRLLSSPSIAGSAEVGQTLTCGHGAWANSPTAYAYQFERNTSAGSVLLTSATT